jgi:hypothetical protein
MSTPNKSRPISVLSRTGDDPPYARPWWFHSSPLSLDDPLAPLPKAALDEGTWTAFSNRDCIALETKWDALPDSLKRRVAKLPDESGVVDKFPAVDANVDVKGEIVEEVDDVSQDDTKVIVGVERLHHVDLCKFRYPQLFC